MIESVSKMSSSNLIITLRSVQWHLNHIALPICFFLGNIGNGLNLIIFCQRSSRTNSCLLYFLSASIIDLFILNFLLVFRIAAEMWNINPGQTSLWFCGCRTYLINCLFLMYRSSILLACIDRMCASSKNAWIRSWSQPNIAYRMIAINCIFWSVLFLPNMLVPILVYGQCFTPQYVGFASYITVSTLAPGILLPSGMLTCGLIILIRLKLMRVRIEPGDARNNRERNVATSQYAILLFVQVATDCSCNLLYPCYLIYTLIFPTPQTSDMATVYSFWRDLAFNLPYVNFSAAFYLYTLSSPSFRRKLITFLKKMPYIQRWLLPNDINNTGITIPMTTMPLRGTKYSDQPTVQ